MRLVFLGPPGAGKGTQAQRLSRQLGLVHLSTGDLFREAVASGTPLGKRVEVYLARGELVPDAITLEVVAERLARSDCVDGCVLDGFPRTRAQAESLDDHLGREGGKLDAVLLLVVSDDEIVERLSGRRVCASCRAVFHVRYRPPRVADRCDHCGSALEQREDDRPATIRRRLRVYRERTAELVDYYRERGLLRQIDGRGSVDEVHDRVVGAVAT